MGFTVPATWETEVPEPSPMTIPAEAPEVEEPILAPPEREKIPVGA